MGLPSGCIEAAFHQGVHVIRLSGDVRLNLCSTLDHYVTNVLREKAFENVIIDLSEAVGVDSTSLGQIAKISILCQERFSLTPTIVSPNPDITKILFAMGFDQVFHIIDKVLSGFTELEAWVIQAVNEEEAREQVISAHKALMSLNQKNKEVFQGLVDALECSR